MKYFYNCRVNNYKLLHYTKNQVYNCISIHETGHEKHFILKTKTDEQANRQKYILQSQGKQK